MAASKDESDPFSDWSSHINKPVYSIDGKRLGLFFTVALLLLHESELIALRKCSNYVIAKPIEQAATVYLSTFMIQSCVSIRIACLPRKTRCLYNIEIQG
jgi:hypothetical protein